MWSTLYLPVRSRGSIPATVYYGVAPSLRDRTRESQHFAERFSIRDWTIIGLPPIPKKSGRARAFLPGLASHQQVPFPAKKEWWAW